MREIHPLALDVLEKLKADGDARYRLNRESPEAKRAARDFDNADEVWRRNGRPIYADPAPTAAAAISTGGYVPGDQMLAPDALHNVLVPAPAAAEPSASPTQPSGGTAGLVTPMTLAQKLRHWLEHGRIDHPDFVRLVRMAADELEAAAEPSAPERHHYCVDCDTVIPETLFSEHIAAHRKPAPPRAEPWSAEKGPPPGITPDMLVGALQDAVPTVPRTDGRKARAANSWRDERPVTRSIRERFNNRVLGMHIPNWAWTLIDVLDEDRAAGAGEGGKS
jgi:hypothetical protein